MFTRKIYVSIISLIVLLFYCFAVYLFDVVSCLLCGLGFMFGVCKKGKEKNLEYLHCIAPTPSL